MRFSTAGLRYRLWRVTALSVGVSLASLLAPPRLEAQQPRARSTQVGAPADSQAGALGDAVTLLQAGRLDEADAATRKITAANPRNAEAHTLLGIVLDQRGLTGEAEREYHAALLLKPNSVTALANLGVLLAKTNRASEAIKEFEAVLRIDPKRATAVYNLGALYAARGDYKRAIPLLERAAGITPGKPGPDDAADVALRLTLLMLTFTLTVARKHWLS